MKTIKWFFGLCLISFFIYGNNIDVQASEQTTDINDFKWYEYSDGTVTITDYIGTDETVVIPSEINGKKVTSIAPQGLWLSDFVNVILPDTIETIDYMAFADCTKLETINLPSSVKEIKECAFYNCESLTTINLPNSISNIGEYAFENCKSLTTINLPDGLTVIKQGLFRYCTSLTSVKIPNTVKTIELCAFGDCKNLTSITIPNSVTSIGDGALIIDPVNQIYSTIHANPNSYAKKYAEQEGIKFNCIGAHSWNKGSITKKPTALKNGTKTYTCTACKTKKTQKIPKLGLPKKGKLITEPKSKNMYKVTKSLAKNGTVELVKANKSKSNITVPNTITIDGVTYKVTSISKSVFKNNKKLKKVTIGKNVKMIGSNAFYGCKNLKTIIVQSTQIKTVGKNTFKGIHSKAKIKVPKSKLKSYKRLFNKKGQKKTVKIVR